MEGGLIWEWGFFNLEKTMVSVLHNELEYNVEKLKYTSVSVYFILRYFQNGAKVEVIQPRIRIKSEPSVGKWNIPESYSRDWLNSLSFVSEE